MRFKAVFCLLALPSFGLAAEMARVAKQTGIVQVYAYGTNISGLPIYAGEDGISPILIPIHTVPLLTRPRNGFYL
jgi:hypothetical protein